VKVFSQPWFIDRKNEIPKGKKPYYVMPVFNYYQVRSELKLRVPTYSFGFHLERLEILTETSTNPSLCGSLLTTS
jgi:hypothetical protein